jgi:mono/diheme cytochrome c family protein
MLRSFQSSSIAATIVLVTAIAAAPSTASRPAGQAAAGGSGADADALMSEGEAIYGTSCQSCHAEPGIDNIGPVLSGNAALMNKDNVIRRVLQGSPAKGMPPFAALSDRQIAAVTTFVRNAWDNAYGAVHEDDVAKVRDALTEK